MRGVVDEIDVHNMKEEEEMKIILNRYKVVAVVGCSRDPRKPAHYVPKYLQSRGYKIVPVNPNAQEILGEKAYPRLTSIPDAFAKMIEVVNVFRPSEEASEIVKQAVDLKVRFGKVKGVWLQKGIVSREAADVARKYGLMIVMDRCMMDEHKKMWE
jgi:hypothetical protein